MSANAQKSDIPNIVHKAEEAKARLRQLSATLTSKDGAATVTVNASGALQRLSFGPRAQGIPLDQLAATVLATAQRAQALAARQIPEVMAPLIGAGSDAMKFLQEQLPAPEVPDEPPAVQQPRFVLNEEQQSAPPPPPPAPRRQPRPPADADGDGEYGSFLRKEW